MLCISNLMFGSWFEVYDQELEKWKKFKLRIIKKYENKNNPKVEKL